MKIHPIVLLTAVLLAVACGRDDINDVDPSDSTGTTTSDEETPLEDISFDRTVTVVYSGSSATVSGTGASVTHSVSGAGVTITNSGSERVRYELSGSSSNGFFKLYGKKKQAIVLNGLSLTNPTGASINIQNGTTYVVINGSNSLADGATYTATPDDEDEKATLFSEDQLIFSGNGSLSVVATGKSGITSDDYLHFMGAPSISVNSSAGHGVRGKDYVTVSGGTLDITVSANTKKGLTSDGDVTFEGGNTTITVSGGVANDGGYTGTAGVKADGNFYMKGGSLSITNSGTGGKGISGDGTATFSGGTVVVACTGNNYGSSSPWGGSSSNSVRAKGIKFDGNVLFCGSNVSATAKAHEAIEAKGTLTVTEGVVYGYSAGDDAINCTSDMTISGGYVYGHTAGTSMGADGLDANGNMYIQGGVVYAICTHGNPDVALDANTEGGKKLYIQGGTLIAVGGLERGAQLTQTCYQASSWNRDTWYAMTIGNNTLCFKTPSGGNSLVVSGSSEPELKSGIEVSGGTEYFGGMLIEGATVSGGSSVNLSTYSANGGGGWW